MIYWVIGFVLILFALYGLRRDCKSVNMIIWTMFVVFTLFQGLRWNTGADWQQYLRVFETCDWKHIFTFDRGGGSRYMEFGYVFLNVLIKSIFREYTFFLLITCGFINLMYRRVLRLYIPTKYQTLAFALFLLMSSMFPVRQALACSFFIGFGVQALLNKDWKVYFCTVAVCCTLHYSCLVLVLFYFIDRFINTYILLGVYLSFSFIVEFLPGLMDMVIQLPGIREMAFASLVERYQNADTMVEKVGLLNNSTTIVFAVLQILFFGWLRKQFKADESKYKLLNLSLNMYVVTSTCRQISLYPGMNEFARFGYFAGVGYLILVAYTFIFFYERYKKDSLFITLVFVSFICFKIRALFYDIYSDLFIPYYSIFEHSTQRDTWIYF